MSTDDPDAEDLAEAFPHVAKLEQQLKEADIDVGDIPQRKGTTRRDLLAGSAGLLGLGGILTGASGTAQAGDDQAGQFGTQAAPQDGYVEDLYDKNGNRVAELPGDGSLDVLQDLSAESVSTDALSINPTETVTTEIALSDDESVEITDYAESQLIWLAGPTGIDAGHAIFLATYQDIRIAAQRDVSVVSNTQLNGTTGPDGTLNISMSDTNLQIENRTGNSRDYIVTRFKAF